MVQRKISFYKWIVFILWAIFLYFANFLPKSYLSTIQVIGGITAFFYIVPFLMFFCWIGLPFSYLFKRLLDKVYTILCPKKIRKEVEIADYMLGGINNVYAKLFFLLVIPAGIGGVIAYYSSFYQIISRLV